MKEGQDLCKATVRTVTNARQVGMMVRSKCACTHRHARVYASSTIENREQTGTWARQVARAMEENLREDQQELKTREPKRKAEDAKRIREIAQEHDRSKGTSHV